MKAVRFEQEGECSPPEDECYPHAHDGIELLRRSPLVRISSFFPRGSSYPVLNLQLQHRPFSPPEGVCSPPGGVCSPPGGVCSHHEGVCSPPGGVYLCSFLRQRGFGRMLLSHEKRKNEIQNKEMNTRRIIIT
jgi:hypothetical protein